MATTKILIIGGTGWIGKFMVEASAKAGHPTFALVRESTLSDPAKTPIIQSFKTLGGDIHDHESLVKAIKQVDVVISTVSYMHLPDQFKIISAIKEAGNVKFGNDVDHANGVDEAKSLIFDDKVQIRRTIESEGIPYTYVVANFFTGHFLPTLSELIATPTPLHKVIILGDGNPRAVFNTEEDVATYTIRTVDDPRTLNKTLYIKQLANTLSCNDLVSLWEKKTGKTLERVYVTEDELLKQIQESSFPVNMGLAICHAAFVKEEHTNFQIDPSFGVEASQLYPHVKYTTVDELLDEKYNRTPFYLNQFIPVNKV
ncbi:NmrA-like domain [Sesbania bispinosa]|nr:NmrA-like domain [Sesbania bispinosa]